jgi:hypothetical protein
MRPAGKMQKVHFRGGNTGKSGRTGPDIALSLPGYRLCTQFRVGARLAFALFTLLNTFQTPYGLTMAFARASGRLYVTQIGIYATPLESVAYLVSTVAAVNTVVTLDCEEGPERK